MLTQSEQEAEKWGAAEPERAPSWLVVVGKGFLEEAAAEPSPER